MTFSPIANLISKEADPTFTLIYSRLAQYLNTDHTDATLMSADLLVELGQFDLAIKEYEKLSSSHPQFFASELGRAEALRALGMKSLQLKF